MPMRAARLSCTTTMPLWARIGVAGRMAGARETGATWAEVRVTLTRSARVAESIRVINWLRIHPLVPAKAGTQHFFTLPGFPLARE